MSLYNMVFGVNSLAGFLLSILGTSHHQVPRFRDCFLIKKEDGTLQICIYTRTGGGNRSTFESAEAYAVNAFGGNYTGPYNDDLRKLDGFIEDKDDSFDSTYASFIYKVPAAYNDFLEEFTAANPETVPPETAERWKMALEAIKEMKPPT